MDAPQVILILPIEGCFGCFQVGTITTGTAMDHGFQDFV